MKDPQRLFSINDPRDFITVLMNELRMDAQTLEKISGINQMAIEKYRKKDSTCDWGELHGVDRRMDFNHLLALLTSGMFACDVDSRLQAVIDVLQTNYGISVKTISIYTRVSEEDIKNFLADGNSVSVETKYKLAVPVLFLHYICK